MSDTHSYVKPGQVAPGQPAPDACMECGAPRNANGHRAALTERLLGELGGLSHEDMDGMLAWLSGYAPEAVEMALAAEKMSS